MAKVPYTPFPTAQPQDGGESVSVNTPEAAFGGNIAAAVQHLGTTVGQVGDEVYQRALALQQLNNETEAKDADIQFSTAIGEKHAQFNSLQGMDRVNAYPKYTQDIQDTYRNMRGGLKSPETQRLFDASAVSVINRSVFSGSVGAAEGLRSAALSSENAKYDLLTKQAFETDDEPGFNAALKEVKQSAGKEASLMEGGWSPEREDLIAKTKASTLAYNRVSGVALKDPLKASQLLQDYTARGLLFGTQAEQATKIVQSSTRTHGMDAIAGDVLMKHRQADGTFDASASAMQDETVDQAQKRYSGDAEIDTYARRGFDTRYNQFNWQQTQERRDVNQVMDNAIVNGARKLTDLPPDQLRRMDAQQRLVFTGKANQYDRSIHEADDRDSYEKLFSTYQSDNAKFMDTDVMTWPNLSQKSRDYFTKLQRQEEANGDPRVDKALRQIKNYDPSTLNDLGLDKRDLQNPDYNSFITNLHDAIQGYQEEHGKPPSEEVTTTKIWPALTRAVVSKGTGWFGMDQNLKQYQTQIPAGARQEFESQSGTKFESDRAFEHAFKVEQFRRLFSKAGEAK